LIGQYYAILLDVSIGLLFAVGFKVVGGYIMKWMLTWFKDSPSPITQSPMKVKGDQASGPRLWFWGGLALLWIAGGLAQIRPALITTQVHTLLARLGGVGQPAFVTSLLENSARVWAAHAIAYNILSILLQILIGILIWLGRGKWVGYAGVGLSLICGLLLWVLGEGFGDLFVRGGSVLTGIPGAGLLIAIASLLLLLPKRMWQSEKTRWYARLLQSVFWLAAAIWQLVWLDLNRNSSSQVGILHSAWWNILALCLFALFGVSPWLKRGKRYLVWLTIAWLAVSWWVEHQFTQYGFVLGIGTAPMLIVIVLLLSGLDQRGRVQS